MTRPALAPAWTTSEAIAERQGCSRSYLREMMDATPPHIARPWVVKGTGKGRSTRYSWEVTRVDQWWREVHEWQASRNAVTATVSAGVTQTDGHTLDSARARGVSRSELAAINAWLDAARPRKGGVRAGAGRHVGCCGCRVGCAQG